MLLTAYELGAGARSQNRRYAEELWPAVVSAERLLYRALAFCWMLKDAGPDRAVEIARAEFGENGLARSAMRWTNARAEQQAGGLPPYFPMCRSF